MEKLKGSTALIVLGIALLAFGAIYPFVTLVVDTTPPIVGTTIPTNGGVYASLITVSVQTYDAESGIDHVDLTVPSNTGTPYQVITYHLTHVTDNGVYEVWAASLQVSITTPGNYTFSGAAYNKAGLSTAISGSFTIYTQLQGNWYINDQQITSTSQTIYSTSTTVSFKFQKTAGIADSYISCWVEEGGAKILTLSLTDSTNHIWTGSHTFSAGTHNLAIKAYDGTATITYSVVGLTIPGAVVWVMTTQQALILAGMLSIVAGVVMRIKKK
jgi:hypothetical protein